MADLKKYQIHCPECGHEFIWDHDELDWQIVNLSKKQKELYAMLNAMEAHNPTTLLFRSDQYRDIKKKCGDLRGVISEMKAIKHNNHGITGEILSKNSRRLSGRNTGMKSFTSWWKSHRKD